MVEVVGVAWKLNRLLFSRLKTNQPPVLSGVKYLKVKGIQLSRFIDAVTVIELVFLVNLKVLSYNQIVLERRIN